MGFFSAKSLSNAVLSGGAGFATGGLSGALAAGAAGLLSGSDAEEQYKYQKRLNSAQMMYQTSMSNTAHQREVADLRAAGLNPILSATGGSGASTPEGASGAAPIVNSSKVLEAIARAQEKRAQDQKDEEIAISKAAQKSQASLNEANIDAKRAEQDYYFNMAQSQLMQNMITAKQLEWIRDNPRLYSMNQFFTNMQPTLNAATTVARAGASVYGASKIGSAGATLSKSLGQIRHDNFERGYWRGYTEGGLNRI